MAEKGRVNVAVRIRPLLPTEISRGCNEVLCYPVNNQIAIGERSFSYDFVFPPSTRQNGKTSLQFAVCNIFYSTL